MAGKYSSKIRNLSVAAAGLGVASQAAGVIVEATPMVTKEGYGYLGFNPTDATGTEAAALGSFNDITHTSLYHSNSGFFYLYTPAGYGDDFDHVGPATGNAITLLNPGDWVNADSGYSGDTSGYPFSIMGTPGEVTYYVGYRLLNQGTGNDETWYGYAEVLVNNVESGTDTMTLVGYRWGNAGEAVQVAPIPEPAVSAFALVAFTGLVAFRRFFRRKR